MVRVVGGLPLSCPTSESPTKHAQQQLLISERESPTLPIGLENYGSRERESPISKRRQIESFVLSENEEESLPPSERQIFEEEDSSACMMEGTEEHMVHVNRRPKEDYSNILDNMDFTDD